MSPWLRNALRLLIDLSALAAALIFISGYFPASLMFADTTASGGDMGTHYYAAYFLRNELLPKGQVTGWCPGNYCGFPLFQMYFPSVFFVMAVLSYIGMKLTIAFKIGTVLGTFMLPVASYLALRFAGVGFPGPALGAFAPLPFLFMQDNSMWGGNIPSTLAGEFSLSFGLALAVLFLGTMRYTMATGRGAVANGVLVGLIGLSHGYTLLWGGLSSLVELITVSGWWRRVRTLITVHGLAILLMGAWFVPLVGYGAWTTAYNHSWPLKNWEEALPKILQPAAIIALVTAVIEGLWALWERRPFSRALLTFWGATIIGVLFWKVAHVFHVVDIRFVPFAQLGICLTAAAGLGVLLGRLPMPEIWPIVGAIILLPWVEQRITFIPSWVKWNYSGFEQKATWPVLKQLSESLRGTYSDPRIVYEHSPDHEALGTVRAFENLPFFTGRGTLEGLYMQGSPTAPFVFYIQSEISKEISCPFPDYGCARFNMDRGLGHLLMFNVSDWIVRSDKVKAAAAVHPDLTLTKTVGNYQIYHLKKATGQYVVPLAWQPSLVRDPKWKEASYRWFKRVGPDDPLPVFAIDATADEAKLFAGDFPEVPKELPRVAVSDLPTLREQVGTDRVVVEGTKPGVPIVVRISYHPRWIARTGEKIWLVGPSFMLLFPKGDRVELVYDGGGPVTIGNLFSLLGILIVAGACVPPVRRRARALWDDAVEEGPGIGALTAWLRDPQVWSMGRRRGLLAMTMLIVSAGFAWGMLHSDSANAENVYREAQRLYEAGQLKEAAVQFHRVTELTPLSATAIHSRYFEAISSFREERWADALPVFERLVEGFPEGINAPEALYHVGLCKLHLGDKAGAQAAWEQVKATYPDATWAKYAQDRLNELAK